MFAGPDWFDKVCHNNQRCGAKIYGVSCRCHQSHDKVRSHELMLEVKFTVAVLQMRLGCVSP